MNHSYIIESKPSVLEFKSSTLMVFIDEVGHESFAPGHDVFGLGGIAVMGRDYERTVVRPWRRLREIINRDPGAPLHAVEFMRRQPRPSVSQIKRFGRFFQMHHFMRIAAFATRRTNIDPDSSPAHTVYNALKARIVDVARSTDFDEVAIIFEASQRGNPLAVRYFSSFEISEGNAPIPISPGFMPKASHEPGLEVADFVMHAVGGYARDRFRGGTRARQDFDAIFGGLVPRRRISYLDIRDVRRTDQPVIPSTE